MMCTGKDEEKYSICNSAASGPRPLCMGASTAPDDRERCRKAAANSFRLLSRGLRSLRKLCRGQYGFYANQRSGAALVQIVIDGHPELKGKFTAQYSENAKTIFGDIQHFSMINAFL